MEQKSIQKRGRNLRAKKSPLGTDLGRSWVVFRGCRRGIFVDFLLSFYYFVNIDVLEEDRCPRAIRERKRPKKGAKREAK